MRLLFFKRSDRLRASRLVVAIFAISWLGFAVAPCQAMAHAQHGSMPAGDCGQCPGAPSGLDNGCTTAAAPDCAMVGTALLGSRDTDLPLPAAGPPPAILGFDAPIRDARPPRDIRVRLLPVPHASIQQRYCTYLN